MAALGQPAREGLTALRENPLTGALRARRPAYCRVNEPRSSKGSERSQPWESSTLPLNR